MNAKQRYTEEELEDIQNKQPKLVVSAEQLIDSIEYYQNHTLPKVPSDEVLKKMEYGDKMLERGKKESEGKLFYELDFEFITQMAERMQSNKDNNKYPRWNWKKPLDEVTIEELKQAMWRHILAVMQGEIKDDGREFGHLEAIANNAMMINYQLKNNK